MSTTPAISAAIPAPIEAPKRPKTGGGGSTLQQDTSAAAAAKAALAKARTLLAADQKAKATDKQIAADQAALAKATTVNAKALARVKADGETVDIKV